MQQLSQTSCGRALKVIFEMMCKTLTTALFRDALALRPQRHSDHSLSLYDLTEALTWRYNKKSTAADIREAVQL
jgi:hypothetical protein